MNRFILLILLLAVLALPAFAQTSTATQTTETAEQTAPVVPDDFESDGCSLFPDGNYRECCVAHDKDYFAGGTCKQRRESDNRLYQCVRSKKGWKNKLIAPIMWVGVRVFGTSILPTPYRWGFGKDREKKARKMQVPIKPETESVKDTPLEPKPDPTTENKPESEEQQNGPPEVETEL